MDVFRVVKDNVTARQVAEYYGRKIGRNGMACCPFHDDKHPSMKLDKRYEFFIGGKQVGKTNKGKELGNAIYQRANGTYEARYIDRFGKQRSVYGKTITEVGRKQREKIFENEKQINVIDTKMTLDEWYAKWITVCKKHCRITTKRTYEIQYNRLRESLGWRKLTSLNLIVLQDAFNELGSDKSRSDCKALLVDILNRAVEADLLLKNPAIGINPIIDGKVKSEKRILSREEMEILLENSQGGMMYPIFVVALGTGMCIGEILGLTWDCIDFDNRVITVKQALAYLPGVETMHSMSFISLRHRQDFARFQ